MNKRTLLNINPKTKLLLFKISGFFGVLGIGFFISAFALWLISPLLAFAGIIWSIKLVFNLGMYSLLAGGITFSILVLYA